MTELIDNIVAKNRIQECIDCPYRQELFHKICVNDTVHDFGSYEGCNQVPIPGSKS